MDIAISLLEKYIADNGEIAHVKVALEDTEAFLVFTRGKYEDNGNTTVIVSPGDLREVLEVNGVFEKLSANLQAERGDRTDRSKIREMLIYGTMAKYLVQMLKGALGERFYPEITPLPRHKDYFRDEDD
jgi:hypothetical protein